MEWENQILRLWNVRRLKRLSETILFTFLNLLKRKLCVFVPNEDLSFLYCFSLEWKFFAKNEKVVYGETTASVCTTYLGGSFSRKLIGSFKQWKLFYCSSFPLPLLFIHRNFCPIFNLYTVLSLAVNFRAVSIE